jgi:hypothetical protein
MIQKREAYVLDKAYLGSLRNPVTFVTGNVTW